MKTTVSKAIERLHQKKNASNFDGGDNKEDRSTRNRTK